jgi:hypothetical protein
LFIVGPAANLIEIMNDRRRAALQRVDASMSVPSRT